MKLKIVSDGTSNGTKVMTEDGKTISCVTKIEWSIGVDHLADCILHCIAVPVEVVADAKIEIPDELSGHCGGKIN